MLFCPAPPRRVVSAGFTEQDDLLALGVVPIAADNEDVASILSAADSACQAAKEAGRNRVHSFEENDIDLMRRRREMQWAARINNALEEGRFEIFRQTILPLQVPETGAHTAPSIAARALLGAKPLLDELERGGFKVDRTRAARGFAHRLEQALSELPGKPLFESILRQLAGVEGAAQ